MTTTLYVNRLLIVVPVASKDASNVLTKQVDLVGGEKAIAAPLSPDGKLPVTHVWCSWAMTDKERDDILARFVDGVGGVRVFDGMKVSAEEVLLAVGLKRVAVAP